MKTGLLHPYPGSKKDWHKYPVWDERQYDAVIEPFVGAGHFTHRMLASGRVKNAFVADVDPAVFSVWSCWGNKRLAAAVERNVWGISDDIKKRIDQQNNSSLNAIFDLLKVEIEQPLDDRKNSLAAASILLRKLVFGGVLRCNAQGKLNVALSKDKLNQFTSWHFEWPYFDESWRLSVSESWQACIQRFEESNCQDAIAFLDPPYWLPPKSRPGRRGTGIMTPAYTHHGNPQGQETLDLFVHCLQRLLANPRVKRIVATNYVSDPLNFEVGRLMDRGKREWWFTPLGPLSTMNNGRKPREDCPVECFWEFGGRRMAGRYEQKNLLELIAC